jgi:hypothetical protein
LNVVLSRLVKGDSKQVGQTGGQNAVEMHEASHSYIVAAESGSYVEYKEAREISVLVPVTPVPSLRLPLCDPTLIEVSSLPA